MIFSRFESVANTPSDHILSRGRRRSTAISEFTICFYIFEGRSIPMLSLSIVSEAQWDGEKGISQVLKGFVQIELGNDKKNLSFVFMDGSIWG